MVTPCHALCPSFFSSSIKRQNLVHYYYCLHDSDLVRSRTFDVNIESCIEPTYVWFILISNNIGPKYKCFVWNWKMYLFDMIGILDELWHLNRIKPRYHPKFLGQFSIYFSWKIGYKVYQFWCLQWLPTKICWRT